MISIWLNRVLAIVAFVATGSACAAQQQVSGSQLPRQEVAATANVVGTYDFSLLPNNKEPITGRLVISNKLGRYYGVVTSPKLSEPLDADSVHVSGSHVFMSTFAGGYTFDFQVDGNTTSNATFTKTMNGTTERGQLSIKREARERIK